MFNKLMASAFLLVVGFVCMAWYSFGGWSSQSKKDTEIENTSSYHSPVVVELFTSQGCSSCPPADVLLQKIKKQYPKNVFALSYHVDYWNYIGWEDPFSKPQFTKRQSLYNQKLGYRGNYTPEVVINGQEHFVGSNAAKMRSKILQYGKKTSENRIGLQGVQRNGRQISFNYTFKGKTQNKALRAILVLDERTTSVKRGENRNRTLTNNNIVVSEKYVEDVAGSGSSAIDVPAWVGQNENLTLMLVAETEDLDITGAAKIKV